MTSLYPQSLPRSLPEIAVFLRQRPMLLAVAYYVAVTLIIIGPWLKPGVILTLDMVFGPFEPTPIDEYYGFDAPVLGAKYIPESLYVVLSAVISDDWAQKAMIGLIFLSAGIGAHTLAPVKWLPAKLFAGTFYMLNPFVYVRLLAGQWFVLAGYAATPFAIWAVLRALEKNTLKHWLIAALLLSVTAANAQAFVFATGASALVIAVWLVRHRSRKQLRGVGWFAAATLVLNLYWLVPALQSEQTVLQEISELDLGAFAPVSQFANPFISIAGLYGFWREGYNYPVTMAAPLYFLIGPVIWLSIYAVISGWRRPLVLTLAVAALVVLVLGPGMSGPFDWLFRFLFNNIPFFDGFRDSQKFVALLALAYAVLGAFGLEAVLVRFGSEHRRKELIRVGSLAALLLLTAAYTFTALFGFGGRLEPAQYPRDWEQARRLLKEETGASSVLVFPWDTYMEYEWLPNDDRSARTLAKAYFGQTLIFPKNVIKRAGIFSQSKSPEQEFIRELTQEGPIRSDFGTRAAELNVSHILLAKAGDWDQYSYLENQTDLVTAFDGPTIRIYRNLIESDRVAIVGDTTGEVSVTRDNPASYRIELQGPDEADVRFVAPNGDVARWRLDGEPPDRVEDGFSGIFSAAGAGTFSYGPAAAARNWILVSAVAAAIVLLQIAGIPAILLHNMRGRISQRSRRPGKP